LKRHLPWLLVGLCSIAISLFWWLPKFTASGNPFDEATLLVYPELCLQGKIVYRDFQAYYGPGNIWLLAGIYHAFGLSIWVERIVGLIERILLLIAFGCLALRLQPKASGTAMLAVLFVLTPLSLIALAWIPAVLLSLTGLLLASRVRLDSEGTNAAAFFSGLAMAFALLFRPDAGPAVLLASAVFLLTWRANQRWRWLGGFILGNIPMLIQVLIATPRAVWNNLVSYPVFVVREGRVIHWENIQPTLKPLLLLAVVLAIANIITGWIAWRRDRGAPLYLAVSVLGAALIHQTLQRCDLAHLAMGSLVTFPLGAVTVQFWIERWLPWKNRFLQIAVGAAACIALFSIAAPGYLQKIALPQLREVVTQEASHPRNVISGGRSWPLDPPAAAFHTTQLLNYINDHSQPGEKLFVGPSDLRRTYFNDLHFYHLLMPRLVPSGYFLELNPLLTNSETSGIDRQIADSHWVITNEIYDRFHEANRSSELGSEKPNLVLKAQFQEVFHSGPFRVLEKTASK